MKRDRRWICNRLHTKEGHVRNARMVEIRRRTVESGFDVAKNAGIDFKVYYLLEKNRRDPLRMKAEKWRTEVHKLCKYWSCEPEDIWPEEALRHADRQRGSAELGLSAYAQRQANPDSLDDVAQLGLLKATYDNLNAHDQLVIEEYVFNHMPVPAMAEKYNVTETTIHNWIYGAMRELRTRATGIADRKSKIVDFFGPGAYKRRSCGKRE